ncbi:SMI1/KNR4 family protein [Streptomyces sp. ISL-11]|uniref:SMI1/KNR4 family protein n=1 Tax=Streptomyces sp. ISL-11 TaxID=2819174 RepID=UPI001BEC24E0|nr:SMI1/KNR4 family protein [Streptomyces sp. ISL-11]MBT2385321.1 SMI1/KNR4 family protein [Streptomyces sp. ISL-11]
MDFASFKDHLAARAPRAMQALRPPAQEADMQRLRGTLRCELSADLAATLQECDGASEPNGRFLPGSYRLLGCDEIVEQYVMLNTLLDELGESMVGYWWHPEWVPFATHIASDCLFVDMREGEDHGRIGEFRHEDHADGIWSSFAVMLHEVAQALQSGRAVREYVPTVVEGELAWEWAD